MLVGRPGAPEQPQRCHTGAQITKFPVSNSKPGTLCGCWPCSKSLSLCRAGFQSLRAQVAVFKLQRAVSWCFRGRGLVACLASDSAPLGFGSFEGLWMVVAFETYRF